MLPRSNQPELPSYLDKGINNRMSLGSFNWRSLRMNCHEHSNSGPNWNTNSAMNFTTH